MGGVLYANVIGTIGFVQSSQLLCGVAWPCLGAVLFVGGVLYFIGSGVALVFALGVLGASSVYSSLLLLFCALLSSNRLSISSLWLSALFVLGVVFVGVGMLSLLESAVP